MEPGEEIQHVAQTVKSPPAMQETQVQSLGWKDPLEKGMATPLQYSCLENPTDKRSLENPTDSEAWRATVGLQRVGHTV